VVPAWQAKVVSVLTIVDVLTEPGSVFVTNEVSKEVITEVLVKHKLEPIDVIVVGDSLIDSVSVT
jgi:hypothetical protein